ncbi:SMAD/FHA domain-containing protein [Fennellomyces sp. T-0311]|nr:SMAD/FHA domain-containing protein [Fennellomyces sp. T-0311]
MLTAALSSPTASRQIRSSAQPDEPYRSSSNDSVPCRHSDPEAGQDAPIPHIRIVPHLDSPRSLVFNVIEREVRDDTVLKIGRFTERFLSPNRITFRSKVVSRGHAEIWTEGGKFYIRDTRSSSGTFLNHVRLSAPNQESRPFQLKDGDVVQLGVDYQGGTEEIFRAVKMRLELNRTWQPQTNTFSLNTFQSLRNLTTPPNNVSVLDAAMGSAPADPADRENIHIEDCCICLYAIAPFQALFVAPCSHTFHFKCCRPLLQSYPGFLCPLCRSYADLDASVAVEATEVLQMLKKRAQDEDKPEGEPSSTSPPQDAKSTERAAEDNLAAASTSSP